eukprot:15459214-Alexandrium_andersonii.AAC.1
MHKAIAAASPGGPLLHLRLLQVLSARARGPPDPPPDLLDSLTYVDDIAPPPAAFVDAPEADAL